MNLVNLKLDSAHLAWFKSPISFFEIGIFTESQHSRFFFIFGHGQFQWINESFASPTFPIVYSLCRRLSIAIWIECSPAMECCDFISLLQCCQNPTSEMEDKYISSNWIDLSNDPIDSREYQHSVPGKYQNVYCPVTIGDSILIQIPHWNRRFPQQSMEKKSRCASFHNVKRIGSKHVSSRSTRQKPVHLDIKP
jgi:hypothetical protein